MTRTTLIVAAGGLLIALASTARAYDAETHALIAYEGYQSSVLTQSGASSVVSRFGFNRLSTSTTFNAYWVTNPTLNPVFYYDTIPPNFNRDTKPPREPNEYERCQMQHLANVSLPPNGASWLVGDPMLSGSTVTYFPMQNWLMRGDLREDDLSPVGYFFAPEKCPLPEADPYGGITRVVNHFYDPINDTALTSGCAVAGYNGVCAKSVDWALGFVDSFASPPVVDTARRNHFTYADARENMWRALVGETGNSTPPYTGAARALDSQERFYRWATTFRSLGDVIHLLQDGAQPQHVRNDAHSPFTSGERQAYEGYTNARVVGVGVGSVNAYVREFFAQPQQVTVPLVVTGYPSHPYPAVMFATPVRFFSTRLKTDGPNVLPDNRYGLMDYTNRGFFTGGTLPGGSGATFLEPPNIDATYTAIAQPCVAGASLAASVSNLTCSHLMHTVPDPVAPSYVDELPHATGQTSPFSAPPLLLESAFKSVVPGSGIQRPHNGYSVGLEEFQTMANLTIPRAISYSAGIINYFFRGQLTVTGTPDKVIAVLNQGTQHTMNAQGYPCVGTLTTDGCPIFGFQSIRVNVQNTTPQITESGSATVVAQAMSATNAGSITTVNPPYLVAVARYHRNTCYAPTLSGERIQAYSSNNTGAITEPTCAGGQTVRTPYQEISVSKSFAATAAQLAPNAAAFEAHFDFSSDPIPVNATDLFIQVVYRGPMGDVTLGQEQDAIAVGTLDVREPLFAVFWNNTDYWWTGSAWSLHNGTNHNEGVESFWACAGSSSPPKLVYRFDGAIGSPAMIDPITSSNVPGVVRLGIVFPQPDFPTQMRTVQGTAVAYAGDAKFPATLSKGSPGEIRQANLENISAITLAAPVATCNTSLPVTQEYWCFDTVQKRRSPTVGPPTIVGIPTIPEFLAPSGNSTGATDVDATPAQPAFAGTTIQAGGTVRFDTDATLLSCPGQP